MPSDVINKVHVLARRSWASNDGLDLGLDGYSDSDDDYDSDDDEGCYPPNLAKVYDTNEDNDEGSVTEQDVIGYNDVAD
jgi:hypothetical protein